MTPSDHLSLRIGDRRSGGEKMVSWNSVPLEITYQVLGWISFAAWSVSFYPQVILNFRRKRYFLIFLIFDSKFGIQASWTFFFFWVNPWKRRSVVGLNFDFVLLNLTKHSSYMIYNVVLFFSPAVQQQYFQKYGRDQVRFYFSLFNKSRTSKKKKWIIIITFESRQGFLHFYKINAYGVWHADDSRGSKWCCVFNACCSLDNNYPVPNCNLWSKCCRLLINLWTKECGKWVINVTSAVLLDHEQRGVQKVSKISMAIVSVVWLAAAVCFFVALPNHSWLWLINVFK